MATSLNTSINSTVSLDGTEGWSEVYQNASFILAWLILTFSLISFFTNLLSAVVYSQRCMRSPINVLLTGLSVIDASLSLLWIPPFVVPCLYVYYQSPFLKTTQSLSHVIIYPLTMMAHCASVWTVVVISLERMIAVLRPFQARWHSIRRSVCALALVTATAALYNFVRFFEFRIAHEDDPNAPIGSMPVLRDGEQYPVYMALYYNGLFFVAHFLIPFTVLTVVNALMIGSIYKASAERRLLTTQQKREHRTAVMMAMTVLSFLLCNTLQLVLNAIELVNPDFFSDRSTLVLAFTLNDVCNLLIVLNTSCTAFIYYFFCQKYRRVASALLLRLFTCHGPSDYTRPPFADDSRKISTSKKLKTSQHLSTVAVPSHEPRLLTSTSVLRLSQGYLPIATSIIGLSQNQLGVDASEALKHLLEMPIDDGRTNRRQQKDSRCDSSSYGPFTEPDTSSTTPKHV